MGSELGVAEDKFLELEKYATSPIYTDREKVALEYADRITRTELDVSDDFFNQLQQFFNEDEIVELTATIAWENCSSKFNRALQIDSQNLWRRSGDKK